MVKVTYNFQWSKYTEGVEIWYNYDVTVSNGVNLWGPMEALKVQSSNSSTKVSGVQVHLLSERPTRDLCACWSMHFRSSEYQNNSPLYSAIIDFRFYYGNLYWKRRARLRSRDPVVPPLLWGTHTLFFYNVNDTVSYWNRLTVKMACLVHPLLRFHWTDRQDWQTKPIA